MPANRIARARTADLVVFGVNGFGVASWMSRVPDVKAALHLTPGQLGLVLLSISVGSLIGLPLAGRLAHRFGAEGAVRLGAWVSMPGLLLAAIAVHLDISPWLRDAGTAARRPGQRGVGRVAEP